MVRMNFYAVVTSFVTWDYLLRFISGRGLTTGLSYLKPIGIPAILNLLTRAVNDTTGNVHPKSIIQSELTIASDV